jgi:ribose transport system ATP-binding protein
MDFDSPTASRALLEVRGITKAFPGTVALDGVDLSIARGEVHALVGENGAGKSTLMNIIAGVLRPDAGRMHFDGKEVRFRNPCEAQRAGIGFVHQELSLCPHVSVAENIYIGRLPHTKAGTIDFARLYRDCGALLAPFGSSIQPRRRVADLTAADQQIVEIAKALSLNCRLLILDEPTSSLTENETAALFALIGSLRNRGISVLYISHRLAEIFRLCGRISVLRDGRYIGTIAAAGADHDTVIRMMVGRTLGNLYPAKSAKIGRELLRVENLCSRGLFNGISFSLNQGEILGFSGLVGSGRSEVMRALCAIDRSSSGAVYRAGIRAVFRDYHDAISQGLAYLTEDRKSQGLFQNLSISSNTTAACLRLIRNRLLIDAKREKSLVNEYVGRLTIRLSTQRAPVSSLSGGNQQKVMIARWLAIGPKILIMDEPTRGIDVGAKAEIHRLLRDLADQGMGIIVVSSELPEIIGLCDRVIVMHEGMIAGMVQDHEINEEAIMRYASGRTSIMAAGEALSIPA